MLLDQTDDKIVTIYSFRSIASFCLTIFLLLIDSRFSTPKGKLVYCQTSFRQLKIADNISYKTYKSTGHKETEKLELKQQVGRPVSFS